MGNLNNSATERQEHSGRSGCQNRGGVRGGSTGGPGGVDGRGEPRFNNIREPSRQRSIPIPTTSNSLSDNVQCPIQQYPTPHPTSFDSPSNNIQLPIRHRSISLPTIPNSPSDIVRFPIQQHPTPHPTTPNSPSNNIQLPIQQHPTPHPTTSNSPSDIVRFPFQQHPTPHPTSFDSPYIDIRHQPRDTVNTLPRYQDTDTNKHQHLLTPSTTSTKSEQFNSVLKMQENVLSPRRPACWCRLRCVSVVQRVLPTFF
jgi:hypothetical protein